MTKAPLIVCLDFLSRDYALQLAELASNKVWGFSINNLIYHYGAEIIYEIKKFGHVFADVKLHDNAANMRANIRCLRTAGADIVSFQSVSGYKPRDDEKSSLAVKLEEIPLYMMADSILGPNNWSDNKIYPVKPNWKKRMVTDGEPESPYEALMTSWRRALGGALKPGDLVLVGKPLTHSEDFTAALDETLEELCYSDLEH